MDHYDVVSTDLALRIAKRKGTPIGWEYAIEKDLISDENRIEHVSFNC
jgi:hypothetical protein